MFSVLGAMVIILVAILTVVAMREIRSFRAKKIREGNFRRNRGLLLQQLVDRDIAERMIISLEEIDKATNNFDEVRKLGG